MNTSKDIKFFTPALSLIEADRVYYSTKSPEAKGPGVIHYTKTKNAMQLR
jgi:hypothetical protein